MNFNLYLQHENRCIKNTRKNYSYCYLRPVVAILHYLHGNKQSLLFHPKILSPIKRTGNKNAACRYLVRVCFSLPSIIEYVSPYTFYKRNANSSYQPSPDNSASYSLPFGEQSHHT